MIDEKKFWELVNVWEFQTKFISSTTQIMAHPSVNEIIKMGYEAIPIILKAMQNNVNLTYPLHKITGEWPVKDEYAGNIQKIKEGWNKWAKKRGYSAAK